MNRFLSLILTLVFSLTFIFANVDSFEKAILPEDFNFYQDGNIQFTIKTLEKVNLDLVIALDNSKSIVLEENLNTSKNIAKELINLLDQNDRVAIVGFDTESENVKLYENLNSDFETIKSTIDSISLNAAQNINSLIKTANLELDNNSQNTKLIILLSNGAPDHGYIDKNGNPIHDIVFENIDNYSYVIYTVSIKNGTYAVDINFMQDIADLTNGQHYAYSDINDLSVILQNFSDEFTFIKNYKPNVQIKDILSEGVEYLGNDFCEFNLETREINCILENIDLNSELKINVPIKVIDYNLEKINDSLTLYYDNYLYDYELFFDSNWQPIINIKYTLIAIDDSFLGYKNTTLEMNILENDLHINPIWFDFNTSKPEINECRFGNKPLETIGGGLHINPENNNFVYVPPKDFLGDGYFWYAITDGIQTDCALGYVQIISIPPILDFIQNKTITQNSKLEFNISASDVDSNRLIFDINNLPTGANFIDYNNNTATFNWTPSTIGTYKITFMVSDENSTVTQNIIITVKAKSTNGGGSSGSNSTKTEINNNEICIPEVKYSEWSECVDGKQTRTFEIINSCNDMVLDFLEKTCFSQETNTDINTKSNLNLDINAITNNDINKENIKLSPTGLFTLGNGLILGIIILILIIIGIIIYKIVISRKTSKQIKKQSKK
jgi:Mg-chelatase subunit ChlD